MHERITCQKCPRCEKEAPRFADQENVETTYDGFTHWSVCPQRRSDSVQFSNRAKRAAVIAGASSPRPTPVRQLRIPSCHPVMRKMPGKRSSHGWLAPGNIAGVRLDRGHAGNMRRQAGRVEQDAPDTSNPARTGTGRTCAPPPPSAAIASGPCTPSAPPGVSHLAGQQQTFESSSDSSITTGRSFPLSCMTLCRFAARSRAVGCLDVGHALEAARRLLLYLAQELQQVADVGTALVEIERVTTTSRTAATLLRLAVMRSTRTTRSTSQPRSSPSA